MTKRISESLPAADSRRRTGGRWSAWLLGVALLVLSVPLGTAPAQATPLHWRAVPVLAYYYLWFDPSSWSRAKVDYPLLGRYSSDDSEVTRQHIRWAKAAGIDGFIVSWKGTETLNRRLAQLVELADAEDFQLVIIYEGRAFDGTPLPVKQIEADFDSFSTLYANDKAFTLFSRPVVIWSGTRAFSQDQVAEVTGTRRQHLLILATEHNRDGYQRLSELVDGDAYYWSSVDPSSFPNYSGKLDGMAQAVHAKGGLWIAPAAVGFDARLIGGTHVVDRRDGETLRQEMAAALKSSPDAIGVISWNEFSENSYLEPSQNYGRHYLDVLATILGAPAPSGGNLDSSEPEGITSVSYGLPVLGGLVALMVASLILICIRSWKSSSMPGPPDV